MLPELFDMLESECLSQIKKAKLSLELLGNKAAGIGDHSTEDFYKNATEALSSLADAEDRLESLYKNYPKKITDSPLAGGA